VSFLKGRTAGVINPLIKGDKSIMAIFKPTDKPWVIVMLGASAQTRIIHRYVNRQDADDALRFINKVVGSVGQFVVAFDVEEVDED
jgi:hypothetical protein